MTTLTTTQAAAHLGITPRHTRHLIKIGQLPATKQGRDWLINEDDLQLAESRGKRGRPRRGRTTMERIHVAQNATHAIEVFDETLDRAAKQYKINILDRRNPAADLPADLAMYDGKTYTTKRAAINRADALAEA